MANKKNIKVRDLKPTKDAKGGGGVHYADKTHTPGLAAGKTPVKEAGFGGGQHGK